MVYLYSCSRDFNIMFGEGINWSVFHMLDLACVEMCKISTQSRQRAQKKASAELHERFIYNTMVWGAYLSMCMSMCLSYCVHVRGITHKSNIFCSVVAYIANIYLYVCISSPYSVLSSESQISESDSDKKYVSALARSFDQQKSSADNE